MENMVAAIEYFYPQFRGQLPWARATLMSGAVQYKPRHTAPMGRSHVELWAAHRVSFGATRRGDGSPNYWSPVPRTPRFGVTASARV